MPGVGIIAAAHSGTAMLLIHNILYLYKNLKTFAYCHSCSKIHKESHTEIHQKSYTIMCV